MYKFIGSNGLFGSETQVKVAEKIGITPETLSRIINQKQNCSKIIAYAICKYIDSEKEINDLFERVD